MEERLTVVFEVKERYIPDAEKYAAKFSAYFQAVEGGILHPLLQSKTHEIFDTKLDAYWGTPTTKFDKDFQYNSIEITAKTIKELREKIEEEIEKIIATLKEVKEENRKATKNLKEYTKIFEI